MKKAEEFIKDFWGKIDGDDDKWGRRISLYDVKQVIKQAQIDAIDATVKSCAEKVTLYNKFDIFKVAEQLKKELE